MHVVHVTPYFAPAFRYGGPPRSVLGLCKALVAAGVSVEVVTTTANGDTPLRPSPPEGDLYEGVRVHYAPAAFPRRAFGARLREPLTAAIARADVCHIHGLWNVPEWTASRRAWAARRPYVLSTRGMLEPAARARHRWRKRAMFACLERQALHRAARVHTTAPVESASVAAFIESSKIVEIPNGVDLPAAASAGADVREQLHIPRGEPVVLFLGRMHPIKRIDLLATAVARIRDKQSNVHLVLAGPDEGRHLRELGGALAPLGSHFHYAGPVDDAGKAAILAASTLVVLCSDSESFGMSIVEAMAAARPVVVTRTCGWTSITADGCGVSVDHTVESLAAGIERVLADPVHAAAMGRRGAEIARRDFSWTSVAARMTSCYAEVIAGA